MKIHKSDTSHAILDKQSRHVKAEKIMIIIDAHSSGIKTLEERKAKLLDIGTGSGHIANYIGTTTELDVYSADIVDERFKKDNYTFKMSTDASIPFPDSFFDVVITNHVIEHVPDQGLHMQEIVRVLKAGGCIYLATPNKYWLYDPHYLLPFISWLPRRLSEYYLKITQNKIWDIYPLSTRAIYKLATDNELDCTNVTPDIIKNPEAYNLDTYKAIHPIVKLIPRGLLNFFAFLLPTSIFILKKNTQP